MLDANALAQLKQLKTDIREDQKIFTGRVKGTASRFGFVVLEEEKEYFLPPTEMDKCLPGDEIEFQVLEDDKGKEYAEVQKILKSEFKEFVGQYCVRGKAHLADPDDTQLNRMLFIPPKERKEAQPGDYIKCRIHKHPFPDGKGQAKITKIIGNAETPFIEVEVTKAKFGLYKEFTDHQLKGLDDISDSTLDELAKGRTDLTDIDFVTIDGANTKDMDDALWANKTDNGWNLYVAIADPAPLVEKLPALEKVAFKRSTSTYLLGQTLHMLPSQLSQQYCSLIAGEKRLALVLKCILNNNAEVIESTFTKAIIESKAKLSYEAVTQFLDEQICDWKNNSQAELINQSVKALSELSQQLLDQRKNNCLVMTDRKDYDFELDEQGHILSIKEETRQPSRQIVEECMILTNRIAADTLKKHDAGIFSTQPGFREEKLEDINTLLTDKAPKLAELDSTHLEDFIKQIKLSETEYPQIRKVLGKYFGRSELSLTAKPHYAQGFESYATITSPIRKYQDLLCHRQLTEILEGKKPTPIKPEQLESIQESLNQSRQADYQLTAWLKCLYMENFMNMSFEGEVSHLNSMGIGVRINETGIDGFIDFRKTESKVSYDSINMILDVDGTSFSLGDTIQVQATGINLDRKQVMFSIADDNASTSEN